MPGLFVLAGNTFPRRMSKRPIQSPPDRHSGAAGLEWGLVQEPVCISIPLPAGSVASATALHRISTCVRKGTRCRCWSSTISACRRDSSAPARSRRSSRIAWTRTNIPISRRSATCAVSAHFLIERDGAITQFVSCHDRAWHAGVSCFDGREACNDFSLGIELEGTDTEPYTDAQYTALAGLTRLLRAAFPAITPERIQGHCDIAPERKTDPGEAFDWSRYRAGLTYSKEET